MLNASAIFIVVELFVGIGPLIPFSIRIITLFHCFGLVKIVKYTQGIKFSKLERKI